MQEIIAVKGGTQQHQSWRTDNISPCLTASMGTGGVRSYDIICVAMRGRYNTNGKTQQQLEPQFSGYSNTITSVGKDNLILEVSKNVLFTDISW